MQDESQVAPPTYCEERKRKNAFGEGKGDSFRQPSTMQEGILCWPMCYRTELSLPEQRLKVSLLGSLVKRVVTVI